MMTFTVRHGRQDLLPDLWSAVADGWRALTRHRRWKNLTAHGSVDGYVRALEVTWSEKHGWHVHIHVLVFTPDAGDVLKSWTGLVEVWTKYVEGSGYTMDEQGQDIRLADVNSGRYLAKGAGSWSVSDEMARWSVKSANAGSLSPMNILQRYAATGEQRFLDLWYAWEMNSFGRRQLTWSRGLRALLQLDRELNDEEIAAQTDDGAEDRELVESLDRGTIEIAGIPYRQWSEDAECVAVLIRLLETAERVETDSLFAELEQVAAEIGCPLEIGLNWQRWLPIDDVQSN